MSGNGISWAICKSAPRSRHITMRASHHSVFYRPDALPAAQPTASKHWRPNNNKNTWGIKIKIIIIIKFCLSFSAIFRILCICEWFGFFQWKNSHELFCGCCLIFIYYYELFLAVLVQLLFVLLYVDVRSSRSPVWAGILCTVEGCTASRWHTHLSRYVAAYWTEPVYHSAGSIPALQLVFWLAELLLPLSSLFSRWWWY